LIIIKGGIAATFEERLKMVFIVDVSIYLVVVVYP